MKNLYFIIGSQDLYGDSVLKQVAADSKKIADFLNSKLTDIEIICQRTVIDSQTAFELFNQVNSDSNCIGVITWMHTFSPAKMWIRGLQILAKPLLHLHTQIDEKIPYDKIDMDYMNLNQSAHGDREYAFILTRLNVPRVSVVGYYKNDKVVSQIQNFVRVAKAIDCSKNLKVAMFGSNMRDVAVTDGDRVESQIKYGWEVNYYGIGDIAEIAQSVTEKEISDKIAEYKCKYEICTDNIDAIKEQAKYEVAFEKFFDTTNVKAFCDNFQDLHGLKELPGLAVQNLMDKGVGFSAEGDYKTAALDAVLMEMAKGVDGATGFIEDYTYDLSLDNELELGSHMLEVSPKLASSKPRIEVHELSIGGKEPPARLVFDSVSGNGVQVCMVDLGDRFRLIAAEIELVKSKPMPKLPVARVMWKVKPSFDVGVKQWLEAGGGHHSVISTALTVQDIEMFAKLTETELIVID